MAQTSDAWRRLTGWIIRSISFPVTLFFSPRQCSPVTGHVLFWTVYGYEAPRGQFIPKTLNKGRQRRKARQRMETVRTLSRYGYRLPLRPVDQKLAQFRFIGEMRLFA